MSASELVHPSSRLWTNQDQAHTSAAIPLVVDLDGTLIRTDLLYETASDFVTRSPLNIFKLSKWVCGGKCNLKDKLAECEALDPAGLPFREDLLGWLKDQRDSGRRLILATASHHSLAVKIAAYLGFFDEVMGTTAGKNLKGVAKRDALVAKFGEKGFDYVGDCSADLPIWRSSRHAYVVSSSRSLNKRAAQFGNVARCFEPGSPSFLSAFLKSMRLYQWAKNLLLFIPLLTAHMYWNLGSISSAILAFFAFGLTASSVYFLNDLVDVVDDRHHARKRHRPFAAGHISLLHGWLAWPILLLSAFTLASLTLAVQFVVALAIYFGITLAYSLFLKRKPIIDVLTLATLYTIRIIAGAAAIEVTLSFWLLSFSMFIFLSLAFIKRFSELKAAYNVGHEGRLRGRGYVVEDIEIVSTMGTSAGYLSVLVLALYIQDPETALMYQSPSIIWLACPMLLYWVSRTWIVAHRGDMHDDPIIFAMKDKVSWVVGLCFCIVFVLARMVA